MFFVFVFLQKGTEAFTSFHHCNLMNCLSVIILKNLNFEPHMGHVLFEMSTKRGKKSEARLYIMHKM